MRKLLAATTFMGAMFASSAVWAACTTDVKKDDLTAEQATGLYECIKEKLQAGYAASGDARTTEYKSWKPAATAPAAPGTHGKRFLYTFANDVAFEEYTKYSDERGPMPVGSVLAKESFNVNKKGAVKHGPLFFMTKVAAGGEAKDFGDWVYAAYSPKGKPMKISQKFCHGCHGAYDDQDSMGYPDEDVRLKTN